MTRKIFFDIREKGNEEICKLNRVVDLGSDKKTIVIPARKIGVFAVVSFVLIYFIIGLVQAPISGGYLLAASSREAERAELEAQLRDLEKQIDEYESVVTEYKKKGNSLESEIKTLNANIARLNLQIKTVTLNLQKLEKDIDSTKSKITQTEGDITNSRESLSVILQNIYESENTSVIEMMMANPKLSDFFLDINNLIAVQDNLRITLEKIIELKNDLIDHKESLALEYDDVAQLKAYQESQKNATKKMEEQKAAVLKVTKGEEKKYQSLLEEKKKTAAQIRSRIFELFGGGELSFGDAYKFAKIAQDATGVRAALILAVLDKESALGRNVGKCKYDVNPYYPAKASNKTTMHPTRDIPVFLTLMKELGISPDSVTVSCPIPSDGAYGGGMGPAQFIPSTWEMYKKQIASLTGNSPASPWNNMDAFMATALYLKNSGANGGTIYDEKVAAAKYYAGSRWKYYLSTYGQRVVDRAESFQDDIDVLNS